MEERYVYIALLTGYTFDTIASMNPFQQRALLESNQSKELHFRTEQEYMEWKMSRGI